MPHERITPWFCGPSHVNLSLTLTFLAPAE